MGLSAARATIAADAALGDIDEARLHTGHPGPAGTSNVLGTGDDVACTFGAAVDGEAETGPLVWVSVSATASVTDISLWAAGQYAGDAQMVGARPAVLGQPFVLDRIVMAVLPTS